MSTENSFAVIRTGGKQYRVAAGQKITVERITGDVGSSVEFPEVLLVSSGETTQVGSPLVTGSKVLGTIVAQDRAPKVVTYKKRRRKGYTKKQGHRQEVTMVKIETISG